MCGAALLVMISRPDVPERFFFFVIVIVAIVSVITNSAVPAVCLKIGYSINVEA